MPRRVRDGRAARAGAVASVANELEDVTELVKAIPQTPGELKAERRTRRLDFDFFRRNPHRLSYVRPYHRGELPLAVILGQPLGAPVRVAVGYVAPGERVRVYIWPGHCDRQACAWAEHQADQRRAALGLRGQA